MAAAAPPASPPGPASSPGPSTPPGPPSLPPPPPSRCRRRPGRARRDVVRPRRREGGGGAAGEAQEAAAGPGPGTGAAAAASGTPGRLFRAPWPRRGGGGAGPSRARGGGGGGAEREQLRGRGPGGTVRFLSHPLSLSASPHRRRRAVPRSSPAMASGAPERRRDASGALPASPEPPGGPQELGAFPPDPKSPAELDGFYGAGRQGKGPELREEPEFFSSLARQEPDVALEAHDEADEPDPALSGAVPAAAHRTQLGPSPEEPLEFPRALFRPDPRSVAVAVAWDASGPAVRPPPRMDESTLESRPGSRHSPESPFSLESRPEPPDSDQDEELDTAAPARERPPNEPKRAEPPDGSRRSVQRPEWLNPTPPFPELASGSAFRAPDAAFRKSLPAKTKTSESSRRAEPDSAASEWAPDAAGARSWTVNAEASVLPAPRGGFARPDEAAEAEERPEREDGPSVFTCIECSIYFRRREHLQEHVLQHSRGGQRGAEPRLCCAECGWAFGEPAALERHRRLHQESREKIIEEIRKLNEFPDEGREARLQCPKCVFGTNSSKTFVQHAKMHVKERKESASRGGAGVFGELHRGAGHGLYGSFPAEEMAAGKASGGACALCGFPAPDEQVLRQHLSYAHSHLAWQPESFEGEPSQPGTSRDSYSPARPAAEFLGKSERLFPAPCRENPAVFEPGPAGFGPGHSRAGSQHARKAAPCPGPLQTSGFAAFPSPKPCQHPRKRAASTGGQRWDETEPGVSAVPQAALDLKRTFRAALRSAAGASEEQRRQLRRAVPVVVLEEATAQPKAAGRARGKPLKRKAPEEPPLGLDVLLLESPLEGQLELEELLGAEGGALKNEERKCPYCPDRFHNGIGLANHVRGHLNRVGVSYNVRHFISAEEVKAIEQKFSFQKKKKKVANFDPGTFSLMRCEFCGAGFDTRAGLSSHARAHLRDFGITNWELTVSPIHILKELLATSHGHPALLRALLPPPERHWEHWEPPAERHWEHWERWEQPQAGTPPASPGWGGDVLAPDEDELVAMEVSSPPVMPKKSPALEPPPPRLGPKLSPEPPGSKGDPQDSKAPSLTTCEVCGACFETRKGLSSHARSHLRQLGVAESESSGAPIDLLYELVRQRPKDGTTLGLPKKPAPPKEPGPARPPPLLLLPKAEGSLNKAIKSPPGFCKAPAPPASPQGAEEKGAKLALSPLPTEPAWGPDEDGPLNLTSGSEPCRDIRCEFCGEFFENRKGLSSHARSHLRQMGVTEWYVNGSPIDTLREILTRRRPGHPKTLTKSLLGSLAPLEPRPPPELHLPGLAKSPPGPAPGAAASSPPPPAPPPPTARKVFPGLSPPSLHKKLKQDQLRVEIKRELMAGAGAGGAGIHPGEAPAPPDPAWAAHEEMAPLNLSSRADPVRDIRCEFCGEFFENRKGLSSHARSHLRQMGVTEWSVNGSPIDTLREILRKKSKPCLIKKEPPGLEPPPPPPPAPPEEEPKIPPGSGSGTAKTLPTGLSLSPLGGRTGKAGAALALAPLGAKNAAGFLAGKRALGEERLGAHGEAKHKAFELGFKAKALHDKASEACCELCGLYFENRKALASHARAHLRQFGVTEWCVNGSPIETLREWIRHRPHKAGAYRSYIQGGRPFSKKFRNSGHPREPRGALAAPPGPFLAKGAALGPEAAPGDGGRGPDTAERALGTALGVVKVEEQRGNFSKFERRQARPPDPGLARSDPVPAPFPRKPEEPRPPPPRPRPVPALVPRPPQTSLVKFVGNIYTLKCRFCEVQFQGPLSIQEQWVRHLQRHILDMSFTKAPPAPPALPAAP